MAGVELSDVLAGGDITAMNLGGALIGDAVQDKDAVDLTLVPLDERITSLEDSHTLLLVAKSEALSQEPTVTDTPLQIEFGLAQTTTHIDLAVDGTITFKTGGRYIISPFFQYGRTGTASASILLNRVLINGAQSGNSLSAKIDNSSILVPWSSSIVITVADNDVVTIEIMRDSTGNNSGGIFAFTPTVIGWAKAPCASIQIYKVN